MKKIKKYITVGLLSLISLSASASCSISSGSMNFGPYNPFSESNLYTSAHININCLNDTDVVIKTTSMIDRNQLRTMNNIQYPEQNDVLAYQLFIDPARNQLFGDGNNNTVVYSGINKNFVLYGTLLKKQNVFKGIYQDNIMLEIIY